MNLIRTLKRVRKHVDDEDIKHELDSLISELEQEEREYEEWLEREYKKTAWRQPIEDIF